MKTMRTLSFAAALAVATAGAGFAATNSTDTTATGPGSVQTTMTPPNSTAVAPQNTVVGQGGQYANSDGPGERHPGQFGRQ